MFIAMNTKNNGNSTVGPIHFVIEASSEWIKIISLEIHSIQFSYFVQLIYNFSIMIVN